MRIGMGLGVGTPSAPSGFVPTNLSGLILWLRGDTGSVSSWTDKSGTGNTFTQATGASQPSIVASMQNGQPGFRFNGTSSNMQCAAFTLSGGSELSIFAAVKLVSAGSFPEIFSSQGATIELRGNSTTGQLQQVRNASTVTGASSVVGTWGKVAAIWRADGTFQTWFNGTSLGSSTTAFALTSGNLTAIGARTNGTLFAQMDILEMFACNVDQTSSRSLVDSYFASQFAI